MSRSDPARGRVWWVRVATLASLVAVVALLHYLIPTTTHAQHQVHIVARKFYLLPLVAAAAWFGLRGALVTAGIVTALFVLHAILDWPGNYMEQANQFGELVAFWAVGLLAGRVADREREQLVRLAHAHEETVAGLVNALDLREHGTGLHSRRVREYALLIAGRLEMSDEARTQLGFGALLHDIGKIAVPDEILLKPGPLTATQWELMRAHPATAYDILRPVQFLREAAEVVRAHHERFDGGGYPRGLKGDAIPLGARVFAIADVYDALTSERPYRLPVGHDEAMAFIRSRSGTDFDPTVVAALRSVTRAAMQEAIAAIGDSRTRVGTPEFAQ